jgi:hypothetical protein
MAARARTTHACTPRTINNRVHMWFGAGNDKHGVFRVPGDADEVSKTKERLNRGEFVLTTTDPFVVASALIAWLTELPEPLIPFAY